MPDPTESGRTGVVTMAAADSPRPTIDPGAATAATVTELRRLRSLYALDLLEGHDERFARFGRIAAQAFDVPIALVSVLDDEQQWFCGAFGTDLAGNQRNESFCTELVDCDDTLLVVEDALTDMRFSELPVVHGTPHIRFYAGVAVCAGDGSRIGTLCVLDIAPREFGADDRRLLRDLADVVENEVRHLELALTDDLTGLANRRAFMSAARRFLALGERRGVPVSVVFADVDGLKAVNDRLGHADGDALLRRAADFLSSTVRSSDLVARIGGDEFAIVQYGYDADSVASAISGLRTALLEANEARHEGEPALSISFGSATAVGGADLDELIAEADASMYDTRLSRVKSRADQ